jgi:FlaA1/EpsC-like NDP-sugar epimerase
MRIDKRTLNFLVITLLTFLTFWWTFFIFDKPFDMNIVLSVILLRVIASYIIFKDYSLSWSKATQKTFLIKSVVYVTPFLLYVPYFHGDIRFALLASELLLYLFSINFLMYTYYFLVNKSKIEKTKSVIIFGAGKAGIKLEEEFRNSEYKVLYFIDDDRALQGRSIDGIKILSREQLISLTKINKYDLLVIAMPSSTQEEINDVYDSLHDYFINLQVLPSLSDILKDEEFTEQLKNVSVEDLLARHPKDLDKEQIEKFIKDKVILVTGAGGSIGSEISRQCIKYGVNKLILLDHSEYNLYTIEQELSSDKIACVMQSVTNKNDLSKTFKHYKPHIVIHAAAYKHVPLVEENIQEGIVNNIIGTKNVIDCAIEYKVDKFVLVSTDKAVRPTNVMGTTKRICELYAQNSNGNGTDIVAVRFGNVLGSSGSVIPKFKRQIEEGKNITVTHPDITRYFMLIPEACELVLQAGEIGSGGEIFILDMGEPVKIVDLAKKMIELSGKNDIEIEFTGLSSSTLLIYNLKKEICFLHHIA